MSYATLKKSTRCFLAGLVAFSLIGSEALCDSKAPSVETRKITMIAFEDAVLLDIVGPLTVFSAANFIISNALRIDKKAYTIEILAEQKGLVRSHSGMTILADGSYLTAAPNIDTLMVPGGPGKDKAGKIQQLLHYLQSMNNLVRRLASICGGATILAKAGLLDGKKATTHWNDLAGLAQRHPAVTVKPDINFIRDGNIYTSGGVMNGVQLALAFVEEDYGTGIALKIAKLIEVDYER